LKAHKRQFRLEGQMFAILVKEQDLSQALLLQLVEVVGARDSKLLDKDHL